MSQPPDGTAGPGAPEPADRAPHEMPTQLAGAAVPPPPPPGQPPQAPPPPPQPVSPPPAAGQVPPPPPAATGQPPQAPGQPPVPGQPQYGYPAAGYGYPQQSPAPGGANPYQQQPPYGYPQSPYAQQPATQPMQQHGWGGNPYGQPQQPPFPAQPGGAGGAGLSGGKLGALIAGIVAAVLVVGGGAYLLTSGGGKPKPVAKGGGSGDGGDNAPHNSTGKVAWTVPAPSVSKQQNIAPTPGMWFSGGDVIKQTPTGVTAYDLNSGQQQWTVPSPGGATCDAAGDIVNNKIAVQYGAHCENLMVVDASSGKLAWNKPLGFPDGTLTDYTDMAMSGDVVAATADQRTVSFQVSTGKPLWHSNDGSDAHDKGFAGGSQMVEVYYTGDNQEQNNHVSLIDPVSGKPKWTWDAPAGTEVVSVISVNPVVVGIGAGNTLITDVWDVDGGRLGGKVSLGGSGSDSKYAIHCAADKMTPCNNVAVAGNTLYLATSEHSGSSAGSADNEIAAFDLSSGSSKWLSKSADAPMQLVSASGGSAIAYQMSTFEKAGKVIKLDPSSGALSTYTTFDDSTAQQEADLDSAGLSDNDFGWHNNTLVISPSQLYSGNTVKYLVGALH